MALPLHIQQSFAAKSNSDEPAAFARALNSIDGSLGETYAVADDQALYLFSRSVSGDNEEFVYNFAELGQLTVQEDRPFAYLIVGSGPDEKSLKFSSYDVEKLQTIVGLWRPADGAAPETAPAESLPIAKPEPTPEPPKDPASSLDGDPSPLVLFCAAAYALIQADGSIATEELEMLNQQVGDPETVALGLQWLRRLGTLDLIERLKKYTHSQKLCLVANLLEISMVDGLLRSTEKKLIKQIMDALGVDEDDYQAIFDVILIKNNLTVFQSDE